MLRAKPCGPTANTQRGGKSIVLISSTDSMYPWQVSGGKDNLELQWATGKPASWTIPTIAELKFSLPVGKGQ